MRKQASSVIYSPSDLIRYLASPFASWLDRCHLENPGAVIPDEQSAEHKLLAQTGEEHEASVLADLRNSEPEIVQIDKADPAAFAQTLAAIETRKPVICQAALIKGVFAGFADFLILNSAGKYQVWDAKLARSPKPYYAIQLCCYSEMLAAVAGESMPEKIGIILGSNERVSFRVEDFIHYYRHIRDSFLALQAGFTGRPEDAPEPVPRADHGRWKSRADQHFLDTDHLVQVAGITVGQIKKLNSAGVGTMTDLSAVAEKAIPKLDPRTLQKLAAQARLQCETRAARLGDPDAKPSYELLSFTGANGESLGLATLPPAHPGDVFFDMEGYPLANGGLEYLFGASSRNGDGSPLEFRDWWAHDRVGERLAFEGFIDWVFDRWKQNAAMHIYHYAAYEVSAVRRLSTRHDSRQEEVDQLLRNEVFVDLYQIIRHGIRVGEDGYSIKKIESLYRAKRTTEVVSGEESIVQYARWIGSGQARNWKSSAILNGIRDYNEDDCKSTAELAAWLRGLADERGISFTPRARPGAPSTQEVLSPRAAERQKTLAQRRTTAAQLREMADQTSLVLADLIEFHRREEKPLWWRMFDREMMLREELRDDSGCIEGLEAGGVPVPVKQSLMQAYRFDPSQECKLAGGGNSYVMFTHNLAVKFNLAEIDASVGTLWLKIGRRSLDEQFGGEFPKSGSVLVDEYVNSEPIPSALAEVASGQLSGTLHAPADALLRRMPPIVPLRNAYESPLDAAIRATRSMSGGCLVIQGPPGTGKTYTASRMIDALLAAGKKVGVSSNGHKVIVNLLAACGEAARQHGRAIDGIKVGDDPEDPLFVANPGLTHVQGNPEGRAAYSAGIVGGTAWLFSRPEWKDALDFLFIDEAGQVPIANAVAMARCARNLVLLGDQMQLKQPVQGSHPGDAGLSALHYALKDTVASRVDAPVFHAVVPAEVGLFLPESRRMHPDVCRFISESIYEGGLGSLADCANQRIALPAGGGVFVTKETGIIFCDVDHDGNVQQSDEEVERIRSVYDELLGREYTAMDGSARPLKAEDFLFIAPYNAQVRALEAALPKGARVGSVDKFQGQEAPVCILSLCSSYGEYGSRGLAFILNRSRINVAISRAQCLAIVVADPRIANSLAGSIPEMMLLNLYCKLTA